LEAQGLRDFALDKTQALKATPAQIEEIKIIESGKGRIAAQAEPDYIRFFLAGENANIMPGLSGNAGPKICAVRGIAHCAGGDKNNFNGDVRRRRGEQCLNSRKPTGHSFRTEPRSRLADTLADPRFDRLTLQLFNFTGWSSISDEELERIAPDIDDRDSGRHG
jgi:hypothetical protein